jgi:hypothetical protein
LRKVSKNFCRGCAPPNGDLSFCPTRPCRSGSQGDPVFPLPGIIPGQRVEKRDLTGTIPLLLSPPGRKVNGVNSGMSTGVIDFT